MNIDTIACRASQLFAERLPNAPVPDHGEFCRWLAKGGGDAAALFRGIERASIRQAQGGSGHELTSDEIAKYVIGTGRKADVRKVRVVAPGNRKGLTK
jgi:hypothetical protein